MIVPVAVVLSLAFSAYLTWDVMKKTRGDQKMQEVAGFIQEGANAFIERQYRTIAVLAVIVSLILGLVVANFGSNLTTTDTTVSAFGIAWRTSIAFLIGSGCSAIAGIVGLTIAIKSNVRTAAAAKHSISEAMMVALRGGAITGFLVVGLSLLGIYVLFVMFDGLSVPELAPFLIVGYGFGGSFVALFALLGGGIYTKAADVGADLVGKIEAKIPEDDPRNAAVVADLVGDNVGDCAGRGADLFESTAAENIGSMILGVSLFLVDPDRNVAWIILPLIVRSCGILASMVGLLSVRASDPDGSGIQKSLDRGFWVTAVLSLIGLGICTTYLLNSLWFFAAGAIGIATTVAFVYITQYYTAGEWRPVKEIAEASKTGSATAIISGIAVAFENTAAPIVVLATSIGTSYVCGLQGVQELGLQLESEYVGGIFGTAIATMGMLMSAAYILAMDTFGPITDNAGGIAEFSEAGEEVRNRTDKLDSVGNTTKALTKGYAVGSAALTALILLSAFIDKADLPGRVVNLAKVEVFVGALLGGMIAYLFSAMAIRAVSVTSAAIIEEVRRQFKERPEIMEGNVRPDYGRTVDIAAGAALRHMIAPGLLPVVAPIIVGLILGAEASAAFLMSATISGVVLALVMNNGGGAWDNAKKYIESGSLKNADGSTVERGSDTHAASVVGDTVGDPWKDTAGPSLNVLVKVLSTITLVLTPLFL